MMTPSMSLSSRTRRRSWTKPGLNVGDVGQRRVVDALGLEIRVDVAERLDLDVLQLCEAALEGVALAANADAGEDDAIVGAEHACAGQRRGVQRRPDHRRCGGQSDARRELAPRDPGALVIDVVVRHGDFPVPRLCRRMWPRRNAQPVGSLALRATSGGARPAGGTRLNPADLKAQGWRSSRARLMFCRPRASLGPRVPKLKRM